MSGRGESRGGKVPCVATARKISCPFTQNVKTQKRCLHYGAAVYLRPLANEYKERTRYVYGVDTQASARQSRRM